MRRAFFTAVLAGVLIAAGNANSQVALKSRNMPAHCEFVYQVRSEIEILWEDGSEGASVEYELFHEYDEVWQDRPILPLNCAGHPVAQCRAFLAFESMSTAQHDLFRQIRFRFIDADGNPLGTKLQSTFGRAFGEPCFTQADQTPFRSRVVLPVAGD